MAAFPAFLEIGADGTCMVHVTSLPGCTIRCATVEEAMKQAPGAIRKYLAWLQRHGEPVTAPEEPVQLEIVGQSTGFGPFDPGDAAALLPTDCGPLPAQELERYLRWLEWSRADLLALVAELPDSVLDWCPAPGEFSLRRLLRHVGNAEEWYVSRVVPAECLPEEWQDDENLPLFEFLEMERRTALAQLRGLKYEQTAMTYYPAAWTQHPEEPWTVRKVLRRFLEHEREHTRQAEAILSAYVSFQSAQQGRSEP